MSDDNAISTVKSVNQIPVISSEQYGHLGKYAAVLSVFEQIGGVKRMADWADTNPTDFFTKVFPKIMQRSTAVEHSGTLTIDDAITRLERMEEPIDTEFYDL